MHAIEVTLNRKETPLTDEIVYYLAYTVTGGKLLEMAILYKHDRDSDVLNIEQMAISCQGVLYAFENHPTMRTRPSINDLFVRSMRRICKLHTDIKAASITIASKGSLLVVNDVWNNPPDVEDDGRTYTLPMPDNICSTCNSPNVEYHLTGVGASFCSSDCATKYWALLSYMEHPLTKLYSFTT
jgi:hypothetical protein